MANDFVNTDLAVCNVFAKSFDVGDETAPPWRTTERHISLVDHIGMRNGFDQADVPFGNNFI